MQGSDDNNRVTSANLKLWTNPWIKVLAAALIAFVLLLIAIAVPYRRLARRVDQQLKGSLANGIDYYSASESVALGDPMSPSDLAAAIQRSAPTVKITLSNGRIASIIDDSTGRALPNYQLKPQLLTSEDGRAKRMPVTFSQMPPLLVHAILSAEDKRFFHHSGIDTLRLAKAVYVDLRDRRKGQGASTITMQLARNLCLRRDKSWKRKLEEVLIAIHLEHKLSKDEIFARYCNLVYLGGDGAFGINGVGEAAQTYFNIDVQ